VSGAFVLTSTVMDTVVSIEVLGPAADADPASADAEHAARAERADAAARAFEWFVRIENACSRFDENSELRQLTQQAGVAVPVSPIVFETLRFALALAEETDGAFDPTVGHRMEARGFDRNYRTGVCLRTAAGGGARASFRDVVLDVDAHALAVEDEGVLDLGAVAKGFAIDMAARELAPFVNFAIDAGGDLYLGGHNAEGEAWSVGVRHPREPNSVFETVRVSNAAVCTSGDYERRSRTGAGHLVDPRTREDDQRPLAAASVTVIAPLAMVADGLATAAFVLGPERGIALLERHGVNGIIVSPSLERFTTSNV